MNQTHRFDIYRSKSEPDSYLAVFANAALPEIPVGPNDWALFKRNTADVDEYGLEDILERGFYFFTPAK